MGVVPLWTFEERYNTPATILHRDDVPEDLRRAMLPKRARENSGA